MFIAPSSQLAAFAQTLANDVRLTSDQIKALQLEIQNDPTGRGYGALQPFDLCLALAMPYTVPNPIPAQLVVKEYIATSDLFNYLATHAGEDQVFYWIKIKKLSTVDDQLGAACLLICETVQNLTEVRLGTEQVAAYEGLLVGAGLVSQEAADAILKQPDPNWAPTVDIPSRLEALGFGTGACLTLSDLQEVLA